MSLSARSLVRQNTFTKDSLEVRNKIMIIMEIKHEEKYEIFERTLHKRGHGEKKEIYEILDS